MPCSARSLFGPNYRDNKPIPVAAMIQSLTSGTTAVTTI